MQFISLNGDLLSAFVFVLSNSYHTCADGLTVKQKLSVLSVCICLLCTVVIADDVFTCRRLYVLQAVPYPRQDAAQATS